jgi:hypothetical protein
MHFTASPHASEVGVESMVWIIIIETGTPQRSVIGRSPMHLASDYIHPYRSAGALA